MNNPIISKNFGLVLLVWLSALCTAFAFEMPASSAGHGGTSASEKSSAVEQSIEKSTTVAPQQKMTGKQKLALALMGKKLQNLKSQLKPTGKYAEQDTQMDTSQIVTIILILLIAILGIWLFGLIGFLIVILLGLLIYYLLYMM